MLQGVLEALRRDRPKAPFYDENIRLKGLGFRGTGLKGLGLKGLGLKV